MAEAPGYGMPTGRGNWSSRAEHGRMKASDTDRDRTADLLRAAYVEGRLTQEELDTRLGQTYAARTYADLAAQTADLPTGRVAATPPRTLPYLAYPPVSSTNGTAVASLICGIMMFFSFGITAVPAVILGHAARRQIRRTRQRGDGLAVAGLILGWLGLAFFTVIVIGLGLAAVATTGHSAPVHSAP
jgi:hypothetical protein